MCPFLCPLLSCIKGYPLFPVIARKEEKMQNTIIKEETLGQRIKAQRIRMGYTQESLAEAMCVPKSTISAYENDKVDIKGSVLIELSHYLYTTPNYLLGFEKTDKTEIISALSKAIEMLK